MRTTLLPITALLQMLHLASAANTRGVFGRSVEEDSPYRKRARRGLKKYQQRHRRTTHQKKEYHGHRDDETVRRTEWVMPKVTTSGGPTETIGSTTDTVAPTTELPSYSPTRDISEGGSPQMDFSMSIMDTTAAMSTETDWPTYTPTITPRPTTGWPSYSPTRDVTEESQMAIDNMLMVNGMSSMSMVNIVDETGWPTYSPTITPPPSTGWPTYSPTNVPELTPRQKRKQERHNAN